jgi:hypothetical protein
MAASRERLGKHIHAATVTHTTIEVLLETGCFYIVRAEELEGKQLGQTSQFLTRGYKENG